MQEQFQTILEDLGYKLQDQGKEWRALPIYRESDNNTSLRIRKKDGSWSDFGTSEGGNFQALVRLTLGLSSLELAKKWLLDRKFSFEDAAPTELTTDYEQPFSAEELKDLEPEYSYWQKRGISMNTLDTFQGGIIKKNVKSSMYQRYVFPIFNSKNKMLGVVGRWIGKENNKVPKWKIQGKVDSFCFPAFVNKDIILNQKEVIIVESIGDMLKLWEAGIRNTLVLFGVNLHRVLLKSLIAIDPKKIIISTNNDIDNNLIGNKAAYFIRQELLQFFDHNQIEIQLPTKNDWGETDLDEIKRVFSR